MRRIALPMVGLGCLLALVAGCFGEALWQGGQLAYRDAAHFYYPLYLRVEQEWAAGRVPLWDPGENGGMPLLGNPTAAVLYPGKLIYTAFGTQHYAWGARTYTLAHILLAVGSMFALLRSWRVSRTGSALGALSYGFGAPILFQYCNIIFLVGAAWTPLALRATDRWLRLGKRWAIGELAVALAMQTLGGDPQSAYLTGLCAGGYALILTSKRQAKGNQSRRKWWFALLGVLGVLAWVALTLAAARYLPDFRAQPKIAEEQPPALPWTPWVSRAFAAAWALLGLRLVLRGLRRREGRPLLKALTGLAGAGALAGALTAAQLLPVVEFSSLSTRAAEEGPHDVFPFSLEPYRVVELAWPNVFGTSFRGNRSWLRLLPPENHRLWIPSLYMGGLTLALALGTLGFRGGPPWRLWLTSIALVSLLGSFGEFGSPTWWARGTPVGQAALGPRDPVDSPSIRFDGKMRDGDGSPYWLMATALPGFGSFRYPSKLLSFTSLALAALAGLGWDRVLAGRRKRTLVVLGCMLAVSIVALGGVGIFRGQIVTRFQGKSSASGGSPFGPFDPHGSFAELCWALVQGVGVATAALVLVLLARRQPRLAGVLALVLITADLLLANARLVRTVPQSEFETTPRVFSLIEQAEQRDPGPPGPYRVHRMPVWEPSTWRASASADRVRDFVHWERATIQPKYGLPLGVQYTLTEGTTELYDYHWFFAGFYRRLDPAVARALRAEVGEKVVYFPRRGFDLWNTRYFVLPAYPGRWDDEHRGFASFLDATEPVYPPPDAFKGPGGDQRQQDWLRREDVQIRRNLAAFPRAWVVHKVRFWEPIHGLNKADRKQKMEELLYQDDILWNDADRPVYDPRELAWVEPEDHRALTSQLSWTERDPDETVKVVSYQPQRVELAAKLNRPGLVILADVLYPGWTLTIDGKAALISRANRLMRGALVKSGSHTLVYEYHPRSFLIGLRISGLGLATLAGLAVWSIWRDTHLPEELAMVESAGRPTLGR
ncbi:MAG: hypothetical protein ABI353_20415 [Isosphaeraceae bacterium]